MSWGSRRLLAVTVVALFLFAALAFLVTTVEPPWPDSNILRHVPPANEPNHLAQLCNAFVLSGMVLGGAFSVLVFGLLVVRKKARAAVFWFVTFAGVVAFDLSLKPLFERPPIGDKANGYSFPSGNGMASMALLLATGMLIVRNRGRRLFFVVGGIVVAVYGAALVYLSWHYPSDVVAGWLLSAAWVSALLTVVRPDRVLDLDRLVASLRARGAGSWLAARTSEVDSD